MDNKALSLMTEYFPQLDDFSNRELAAQVAGIWYHLWQESGWAKIEDAIFNPLCPRISLIQHTRAVTDGAVNLARGRNNIYSECLDTDTILAGALLHDVSKLIEYEPGPNGGVKSRRGKLFQHGFLGAHQALIEGLPDEVVHIIICHTGDSRVIPQTAEALIVYCVDLVDADLSRLKSGAPLLMQKHK